MNDKKLVYLISVIVALSLVYLLLAKDFLTFNSGGEEKEKNKEEKQKQSKVLSSEELEIQRQAQALVEDAIRSQDDDYQKQKEEKNKNMKQEEQKKYITTASGLKYRVLKKGNGKEHPTLQSSVTVHYVGTLEDGRVFDSSRARGEKITFPLSGVIKGWQEGLQLMTIGSKYEFVIPPELAYGPSGSGHPLSGKTLIFEVELFDIK